MFDRDYAAEKAVPLLMVGGFSMHLVNVGRYVQFGSANIEEVLLPTVDLVLALWMAYCAFGLIVGYRRFVGRFRIRGWRKVAYWLITFYVAASLPGHARFLLFGDTSYFDLFPWWFSPIIMAFYLLVIGYFWTLPWHQPTPAEKPLGRGAVSA